MIYADANVIIRLLAGLPAVRAPIEIRLLPFKGMLGFLATSRLSRLECRAKQILHEVPRDSEMERARRRANSGCSVRSSRPRRLTSADTSARARLPLTPA